MISKCKWLVTQAMETNKLNYLEMYKINKWAQNYLKEHPEEEYCCILLNNGGNIILGRRK